MQLPSIFVLFTLLQACAIPAVADTWPDLPITNGAVEIPAQPWPQKPGPRKVRVLVTYPGGKLDQVNAQTGVMLTLHNWGGEDCGGSASPQALASRLNVVAICVNYLQSGRQASILDPEPYDFGYLQGLDALRALWFVRHGLQERGQPFDDARIYCTGGSGGGNVTQMAVKLAPHTFACVIDMCGMKKLSHDIAFGLPGGSGLNARWSRDPESPNYLSVDHQELRFVGHPGHLAVRKQLGSTTKIMVVHGRDDTTCPFADAEEMVHNMQAAGLDVVPHFIGNEDLDGKVFTSTGHPLGNRTEIVFRVAGKYLMPEGDETLRVTGGTNFDRQTDVVYPTTQGRFVISYQQGYPTARFEAEAAPPHYDEHQVLDHFLDEQGHPQPIQTPDDWQRRRAHVLANFQLVTGKLPPATMRPPLDVKHLEKVSVGETEWQKITYQSDPLDRVPAYLFVPKSSASVQPNSLPAVLCLHQTTPAGKDESVGLAGRANMHYALELARRGYVVLVPDYPSLGEHTYDFVANPEYASGTLKAVWDNIRGLDLLESMPEVDATRIGVIGHSLGGHNGMFTAVFDSRVAVIVSSCGFARFGKDDVPSWTGPRYMPRIATTYGNDANRLPFDFGELVASFAPRPFLAIATTDDRDFDVDGVRDVLKTARPVYALLGKPEHLQAVYPTGPHDFPPDARKQAYEFLDQHLNPKNGENP